MEEQVMYDLFDRYIRGELNEQELDDFLARLDSDSDFKEAFNTYYLVVEGIREHERQELRAYMDQKARVRFMGNPWSKTWTYASAAVLLAFGVLYISLDQSTKQESVAEREAPDRAKSPIDTVAQGEVEEENENLAMEAPKPSEPATPPPTVQEIEDAEEIAELADEVEVAQEFDTEMVYPDPLGGDGRVAMEQEDELPVKADTRVHDMIVTLNISFEKDAKTDTVLKEVAKKKEQLRSEKIAIQFWKSPINYKGYRFDGRKLEVFGLDTFDQVSLKYRVLDADLKVYEVYLKYGNAYYRLDDDNRYHAYVRVKDEAIIEELK